MRNLEPAYPCNTHFAFDLTAAAVKTISFKNAAGQPIRAERLYLRTELTGGAEGDKCHWKGNPVASLGTNPDADHMFVYAQEAALLIPTQVQDFRVFTASAAGTFRVYVEAYGYEDLSNSTVA